MNKKINDEQEGFKLIENFVKFYPKTSYPTANDDLIEMFVRGARLLGFKYMILPQDDAICPSCNTVIGKIKKNGLSLHVLTGNNTMCNYCFVEKFQDEKWHDTETCTHTNTGSWTRDDCMAVLKSFEYSYKAILKERKK